jgi:hypothetical protein
MRKVDYNMARQLGFPARPAYGQTVVDSAGHVWVWPHKDGEGLNDLGQWVEAIGAGISFFSSLFGGNSKKKQQQDQAIQQLQQQNDSLSLQLAADQASPWHMNKMYLALIAVVLVGFVAMKK